MNQSEYTVIWDWNGTLLDDLEWCIGVINGLLKKRGLKTLDSPEAYHEVFGFPIIDYYRRAGFDFDIEPFEALAAEYMEAYHDKNARIRLFSNVVPVLESFRKKGFRQVILSASKLDNLMSQIRLFDIEHYFDEILGISDIYAKSKLEAGRAYIERSGVRNAVLIGDSVHDMEVSVALGADCVLVSTGHQSRTSLLSCGVPVVDDLAEVLGVIEKIRR